MSRSLLALLSFLAPSLASCGDLLAVDVATTTSSHPVIGGEETWERPEIGVVSTTGACTGTLIAADVVLTAAHCLGSGPPTLCEHELGPENPHGVAPCTPCRQDTPGSYGSFEIFTATGAPTLSRTVDRYVALSCDGLGEGDLALLHLNEPVPADVAVPAGIAFPPAAGEWVTLYGYGCGSPGGSFGVKRAFTYQHLVHGPDNVCGGDSGGPTVIGTDGAVFAVTSGWSWWGNIYAHVGPYHDAINAEIAAWGAANDGGGAICGDGDCGATESCSTCASDCGACPLAAPAGVAASVVGDAVLLTWAVSPAAASYGVYRGTMSGARSWVGNTAGTSWTDLGLAPWTYFYVVRSVASDGSESGDSNEASATVEARAPDW